MTVTVAAAVLAVLCWPAPIRPGRRLRPLPVPRSGPTSAQQAVRRPVVGAVVLALTALVVAGGPWWLALLLAGAAVVGGRTRNADQPSPDEVPITADLMSACLSAGAGLGDALAASLVASGPWLRSRGEPVVAALRAGAPPDEAWGDWLADDRLAPIARTCMRTTGSGAAAATELMRVAARMRAATRAMRQQRVARAAVWIVLPLGACFLPAFVAVGVVPLVVSLVAQLR